MNMKMAVVSITKSAKYPNYSKGSQTMFSNFTIFVATISQGQQGFEGNYIYSKAPSYKTPRCTDPADTRYELGPKIFQIHSFPNVGHSFTPQLQVYEVSPIVNKTRDTRVLRRPRVLQENLKGLLELQGTLRNSWNT